MTDLDARVARLNDILSTVNLLSWDSRVTMPAGGAETRGHQIATLKRIARDMLLDPAMADAAEAAREAATDPVARRGAEATAAGAPRTKARQARRRAARQRGLRRGAEPSPAHGDCVHRSSSATR